MDGVSITYGLPPQHIWTFFSGYCLCDDPNLPGEYGPPSFVGESYFCEYTATTDPMWDGMGCESNCCAFNSPPWFSSTLPAPISDDIQVRICTNQGISDERVFISLVQLYIQ